MQFILCKKPLMSARVKSTSLFFSEEYDTKKLAQSLHRLGQHLQTEFIMKNYTLALPLLFTAACEIVQPETTTVPSLDTMTACTDVETRAELTIAATNADNTVALIIYDTEGYNAQGSIWGEGMENQAMIELHVGTNVGKNNCTDDVESETITEVYLPIDSSELPASLQTEEESSFGYWVMFPLCEECGPIAEISMENFWFVSDSGDYLKIDSTDLSVDVTSYSGGAETSD